jgi:REP element-mobilizing transposase RayT
MEFKLKTKQFWRSQLPHWEVESGYYFITIRCAGSLPKAVTLQLKEISQSLAQIDASNDGFRNLQRRYFQTVEKYADTHGGFCPFTNAECAENIVERLAELANVGWEVPHYTIMPNHVHFLTKTELDSEDMKPTLSEWKGKTSRESNQVLDRAGAFWQRDWFDHVVRHEVELTRIIDYIQQNPVKAKLCQNWQDYPYVK